MMPARVIGLAGWSGSGKTTLAEQLITTITQRGFDIAVVKHAHHKFDADTPGKDSWRHRKAGARQVVISSALRYAHFIEHDHNQPRLDEILTRIQPCDLILVEGFKHETIPKLEIWRKIIGKPLLYPDDPNIIAVASDGMILDCPLLLLDLNDVQKIADFLLEHLGISERKL